MSQKVNPFGDDLAVIQKLDDEPNDVGGLSAEQLKAKFDEAPLAIQKYINEVLVQAHNALGVDLDNLAEQLANHVDTDPDSLKSANIAIEADLIEKYGLTSLVPNVHDALEKLGPLAGHVDYLADTETFLAEETARYLGLEEAVPDDAFALLAQRNAQNFVLEKITSSQTWVAPKAAGQRFKVFAVGGGGGGGGSSTNEIRGGGGGGGYIEIEDVEVAEGAAVTIVCGAGGGANNDGGMTSFGTMVHAQGGKHGTDEGDKSGGDGGDGGSGGGGALYGRGGDGSVYGGGGGAGRNGSRGGNGGTYGGGAGAGGDSTAASRGGSGGAYGGNGGSRMSGGADGTKSAVFKFWQTLFDFKSLGNTGTGGTRSGNNGGGGGGGGYGGNGGDSSSYGGGGGGGYGGNGGKASSTNSGGGGGGYGGNGGDSSSGIYSGGGGGGGFFANGATTSAYGGGGGGGFFSDASGQRGGNGGVLIMYIKEE